MILGTHTIINERGQGNGKRNCILLVEDERGGLLEGIQDIPRDFETQKSDYCEVKDYLKNISPQAVVFNINGKNGEIKELLDTFRKEHPNTYWVISGDQISNVDLVEYMRHGVSDFIKQPLERNEINDLMQRIEYFQAKNNGQASSGGHSVISFFSCKGGVGLSFLAANMATMIAKHQLGRVILADFVLQHGNIAELLDMLPKYTLLDLMENFDRLDLKLLDSSLQKHKSGISVLPCPKNPEDSEYFAAKETADMLKVLKKSFNYTLLDVGHELNTTAISCLDVSDKIFLVATPDLPSLCNAKVALETFKKLSYKENKVKLLINRTGMKGEIETAIIEKNLDYTIDYKIADDTVHALEAINQGVPIHEVAKKSETTKSLYRLVMEIHNELKEAA